MSAYLTSIKALLDCCNVLVAAGWILLIIFAVTGVAWVFAIFAGLYCGIIVCYTWALVTFLREKHRTPTKGKSK